MSTILRPYEALKLANSIFQNLHKTLISSKMQTFSSTTLPNLKPLNSKISNFMKNGFVKEAQKLFEQTPQTNTVTYNAMIRGYFQNGQFDNAVYLFDTMPDRDIFSYNTMIAGLMQNGDVDYARKIFDRMLVKDVVTWNSMISGFVRNGLIDVAAKFFNAMPNRNAISWNLMIAGVLSHNKLDLAENLFKSMSFRDVASWTIMISAYMSAGRVDEARELFETMPVKDIQTWNTMITGYIKHNLIVFAEGLFKRMPVRDFVSWNEMINGLVNSKRISDAISLFNEMPEKSQKSWNSILLGLIRYGLIKEAHSMLEKSSFSDVVSRTNLIVGYFEISDVETVIKLFELMSIRDTTSWNVIICGLGENDHGEEGLMFFIKMKEEGYLLDESTFTSVLTICSNLPSLNLGKQTHVQVIKTGINSFLAVSNAMVTMYARCGNMDSALLEFHSMRTYDVISWNSIICGFAHHGNGEKALEMFKQMTLTDTEPNHITFIGILSACSHAGLVDEGKFYFDYMKNKCFVTPTCEHYTCIVDLVGRFGLINEALCYINQMKLDKIEVPTSVWGALLAACRVHKNMEVGEIAGERVLEKDSHNSGVYLILAEMYLGCGRRKEAEKMWDRMKRNGVKKQPGCSWIEINNSNHVFLSGFNAHVEFAGICFLLDLLYMDIEFESSTKECSTF